MIDISRLFPRTIDNTFRGHPFALYLFFALTALTLWRSQTHVFAADGGARSIASITLDQFTTGGANTVITVFALWGISQLIVAFIYAAVAIRYRALIPFMYLLFTAEYALRITLPMHKPGVETAGTAPGEIGNIVFVVLGPVLLALSLWTGGSKSEKGITL